MAEKKKLLTIEAVAELLEIKVGSVRALISSDLSFPEPYNKDKLFAKKVKRLWDSEEIESYKKQKDAAKKGIVARQINADLSRTFLLGARP